jgi:5'-deoxynucleotidase YfbR-like HD superfamily hydrolase
MPTDPNATPFSELISGAMVNLADPDYSDVRITDIATALSRESRFNGHTSQFYSVALHCIIGAHISPLYASYAFLMHDATEAVLKDIPSPLKSLMLEYREIEEKHNAAIARRFYVPNNEKEIIKQIDKIMLLAEMVELRGYDDETARSEIPESDHDKYKAARLMIAQRKNWTMKECAGQFIANWINYAPDDAVFAEFTTVKNENGSDILREFLREFLREKLHVWS